MGKSAAALKNEQAVLTYNSSGLAAESCYSLVRLAAETILAPFTAILTRENPPDILSSAQEST